LMLSKPLRNTVLTSREFQNDALPGRLMLFQPFPIGDILSV
jgi:hypothetical protein